MTDGWSTPENSAAYREAAADLENHIPHYTDASGITHWDNAKGDPSSIWHGLSGDAANNGATTIGNQLTTHADSTKSLADTLRNTADHIDATNAASSALSAQRASDFANAPTMADRIAANQNYLDNLSALQAAHASGMQDLTSQLSSQAASGSPQLADAGTVRQTAEPIAQSSLPPHAPAGTGITPGRATPPGVTAPSPAPGTSSTPRTLTGVSLNERLASMTRNVPGGITAPMGAPLTSPTSTVVAAPGKSQPTTAAMVPAPAPVPVPVEGEKSKPASPLDGLSPSMTEAQAVLSCLVDQFKKAGWITPLAVAVVRAGEARRTVYATGPALSVWPSGVKLPVSTLPLDQVQGIDGPQAREMQGLSSPSDKLVGLLSDTPWHIDAVVTTVADDADGQQVIALDDVELHRISDSGHAAYPSVSRSSMATVMPEDAATCAAAARMTLRLSFDPLDLTEAARSLRRAERDESNLDDYLGVYARWLMADALAHIKTDATYPLSVLLGLRLSPVS